jgi:ABC-type antimicrobial peptide transport system permease subunit
MKKSIIYSIVTFCMLFIITFFVVKCDGGFEKTNMVYLPHSLTWQEMISYIPTISIISIVGMLLCLYVLKKNKLL